MCRPHITKIMKGTENNERRIKKNVCRVFHMWIGPFILRIQFISYLAWPAVHLRALYYSDQIEELSDRDLPRDFNKTRLTQEYTRVTVRGSTSELAACRASWDTSYFFSQLPRSHLWLHAAEACTKDHIQTNRLTGEINHNESDRGPKTSMQWYSACQGESNY